MKNLVTFYDDISTRLWLVLLVINLMIETNQDLCITSYMLASSLELV